MLMFIIVYVLVDYSQYDYLCNSLPCQKIVLLSRTLNLLDLICNVRKPATCLPFTVHTLNQHFINIQGFSNICVLLF